MELNQHLVVQIGQELDETPPRRTREVVTTLVVAMGFPTLADAERSMEGRNNYSLGIPFNIWCKDRLWNNAWAREALGSFIDGNTVTDDGFLQFNKQPDNNYNPHNVVLYNLSGKLLVRTQSPNYESFYNYVSDKIDTAIILYQKTHGKKACRAKYNADFNKCGEMTRRQVSNLTKRTFRRLDYKKLQLAGYPIPPEVKKHS